MKQFWIRRNSCRLDGYDYSLPGPYFITLKTQGGTSHFATFDSAGMALTPAGKMVEATWKQMPEYHSEIQLDTFVVMPDHFHALLYLRPRNPFQGPSGGANRPLVLGDVVRHFKSLTTVRYVEGVGQLGWPPFNGRLWQRTYFDVIVDGAVPLNKIRKYIQDNPARQWVRCQNRSR